MAKRFEDIIQALATTLEAKNRLLAKIDSFSEEVEALKKQLAQTHTNLELESKKNSTLSTQLEVEQKKSIELEDQYAAALEEGQKLGIQNFLKFDDFVGDLAIMNTLILQHDYYSASKEVQALNLPGFDIEKFSNYNLKTVEQIDHPVEGYSKGYKLADLVVDPSLLVTIPEEEQDGL